MEAPDLAALFSSDAIVEPYGALYLHIPFCVKRCRYCDFATRACSQDSPAIDEYVERLALALRHAGKRGYLSQVKTVYLGGGTPSFVGMERLSSLLYMLSVSMHLTPKVEFTMEVNPESLTPAMIRDLWALGVNRLSIGVQSFDDRVLGLLGRAHDAEQAKCAVREALTRFDNVSVDLMCGIPGQTDESLVSSVQQAIDLGVAHVSVYPLMIEEGTPFAAMVESGELPEPTEDAAADHMQLAARLLEAAGFARYEVASYARPGYKCRHNQAYWTGVPYLGLGDSACTMTQAAWGGPGFSGVGGAHFVPRAMRRLRIRNGEIEDDLDFKEILAENLMLGMRMTEGAPDALIQQARAAGLSVDDALRELVGQGLAVWDAQGVRPTELGWLWGNRLYGRLLELAP